MKLAGTVALVTGASTGIGEGIAVRLASVGSSVVVVARSRARLDEVVAQILARGGAAIPVVADLVEDSVPDEVVARAVERFGRLDIVVNNAGLASPSRVVDDDHSDWAPMVDLNVKALMRVSAAALPHLLAAAKDSDRRVADLVNIASIAGRRPQAGAGVYAATKAAVCAFSEALRQEVTARRVRVGLITPGAILTEAAVEANRRIGKPAPSDDAPYLAVDDIAEAVEYMVSRPARAAVNEMILRPSAQVS